MQVKYRNVPKQRNGRDKGDKPIKEISQLEEKPNQKDQAKGPYHSETNEPNGINEPIKKNQPTQRTDKPKK